VEVEMSAADERALVSGWGELARSGFSEEEAVDWITDCRFLISN
jgi:hypothetical protein